MNVDEIQVRPGVRLRRIAMHLESGIYINLQETARQLRELADRYEAIELALSKVDPDRPARGVNG